MAGNVRLPLTEGRHTLKSEALIQDIAMLNTTQSQWKQRGNPKRAYIEQGKKTTRNPCTVNPGRQRIGSLQNSSFRRLPHSNGRHAMDSDSPRTAAHKRRTEWADGLAAFFHGSRQ